MKNLYIPVALFTLLLATPVSADMCHASKTIKEGVSTEGLSELRVNVLAGYLEVRPGSAGSVEFTGEACTDEQQWLSMMTLDVVRTGNMLELTVIIPYEDHDFDAEYAYMDVDLRIPADLPVIVKDSSGDMVIDAVSVTSVDDSSGNIRVKNNKTSLIIRDSSGNMEIRDVDGNLEISDSSGSIDVRNVIGTVYIPRDSSGGIEIDTVSGKVTIERDGSGDIDIQHIQADVEIGSDGSGGIRIKDVKGNVLIGSDGSGSINVADISGNLLVEAKGSGTMRTHGIEGEISLPR